MRRHLKQEAREAKVLAKLLRDFNRKYVTGHPTLVLRPGRVFDPAALAQDFDALVSLVEDQAGACKDMGGPPRKMPAFEALAEGLTRAYRRATKRTGTAAMYGRAAAGYATWWKLCCLRRASSPSRRLESNLKLLLGGASATLLN
jgi:hypothetical protein